MTSEESAEGIESSRFQPRHLIVTIYGLYARPSGGWMAVSSLVRLLADLGVDEPAVRSAVSRLKRRGLLHAHRVQGTVGYNLSDEAHRILADGDYRIFARERADLADGWLLAVFSVPEDERQKRHVLRTQLTGLGFGTITPGTWIAPAHAYEEASHRLSRLGLLGYVNLFRADYLSATADLRSKVGQWWDLAQLQLLYAEFSDTYGPVAERWSGRRDQPELDAFRDYVTVLTDWRRLPYLDPGLPAEMLPRRWQGSRAGDIFTRLRTRLENPARRHAMRAIAQGSSARTA